MYPSWNGVVTNVRVFAHAAGTGIAVLAAFWFVSRVVSALISRFADRDTANADLIGLLARTAKVALQVFGAVTALGTAGVDVRALVAGLGLTGFALGFAFRDVLSNVLAGVLILMYRPFNRGERIAVTGLEGTVTGIDLRYTVLESDGKTILIPNANLFTNPIVVTR